MSPHCNRQFFIQRLCKGLYAEFLHGGKIKSHQLDGEHVLPRTVLRMLTVGCRVLLCSSSGFPGTFRLFTHRLLQDDDYLILPEVIQTLHTRITELERPSAVYLLPPHERLSSDLRAVYTSDMDGNLHTSFAWLGHGTMMHRSLASEFLSLLQVLKISEEETRMADNYFSVLRNHPPETWFDQGIELGGGQAFTVGSEGHERNKKHVVSLKTASLWC